MTRLGMARRVGVMKVERRKKERGRKEVEKSNKKLDYHVWKEDGRWKDR